MPKTKTNKRRKLYKRYDGKCQLRLLCDGNRRLPFNETTIQHVIPLALGGSNFIENLTLACGPCNQEDSRRYNKYGKSN